MFAKILFSEDVISNIILKKTKYLSYIHSSYPPAHSTTLSLPHTHTHTLIHVNFLKSEDDYQGTNLHDIIFSKGVR